MGKQKRATRDKCTKKSVLVQQRKRDSSPGVTKFLKFMIGENLSRFLYLPPEFAVTAMHLAGQKTQLKDVNGLRWSVTVTVIDGSLAFGGGWSSFFVDHNITEGEVLGFEYVKENYFLVTVYKASCCEKARFDLSRPQLNKRRRAAMETDSAVDAVQGPGIRSNLRSTSPISNAIIPDFRNATENAEYWRQVSVMEIDCAQYREEDRSFLLDLSKFEMANETNRAVVEKETIYSIEASRADTYKRSLEARIAPSRIETTEITIPEVKMASCQMKMAKEEAIGLQMVAMDVDQINNPSSDIFSRKIKMASVAKASPVETDIRMQSKIHWKDTSAYLNLASHVSVKPVEASTCTLGTVKLKHPVKKKEGNKTGETSRDGDTGENLDVKHEKASWAGIGGSSKIAGMEHGVKHKPLESPISSFMFKDPGKLMVKKELAESTQSSYDFGEVPCGEEPTAEGKYERMFTPVVKVERGVETETGMKAGPNIPHSDIGPLDVTGSHTFSAEVKTLSYLDLPFSILSSISSGDKIRRKVMFLRDPEGRVWPVLFANLLSARALTTNWRIFCSSNNIMPGDVCSFIADGEGVYGVEITQKLCSGRQSPSSLRRCLGVVRSPTALSECRLSNRLGVPKRVASSPRH